MIITKIRLQEEYPMSSSTRSWPLPSCDLELNSSSGANGYIFKHGVGLEPPELNEIVDGFDTNGTPAVDDAPEDREIVLRIGLYPGVGQTYSSLRDHLYKFISRTVSVNLMNGSIIVARTVGFVRRVEAVHFSNRPEVQITIQCHEAEFVAPENVLIPLGELELTEPVISYEEGTAPTGFQLHFKFLQTKTFILISNHSRVRSYSGLPLENEFKITYNFLVNDIIVISTERKKKEITLLRSGSYYDLAGYVNAGAVWPKLYPGVNAFEWNLDSTWVEWISGSYYPKYWGV